MIVSARYLSILPPLGFARLISGWARFAIPTSLTDGDGQQIVGRERNQRASDRQLAHNAVVSRRVNSNVICFSNYTMKRILSPILIALVFICASRATDASNIHSIRDVDFKNFTFNWYPYWCDTPATGRKIILTDGRMETGFDYGKEPRTFYLIDDGVKYGNLTRDGNDEAVVVLWIVTSGTARHGV